MYAQTYKRGWGTNIFTFQMNHLRHNFDRKKRDSGKKIWECSLHNK